MRISYLVNTEQMLGHGKGLAGVPVTADGAGICRR